MCCTIANQFSLSTTRTLIIVNEGVMIHPRIAPQYLNPIEAEKTRWDHTPIPMLHRRQEFTTHYVYTHFLQRFYTTCHEGPCFHYHVNAYYLRLISASYLHVCLPITLHCRFSGLLQLICCICPLRWN